MLLSKLHRSFFNLKIKNKISISMLSLLVFLILFIYITSIVSLQKVILSDSLQRIYSSQETCEDSLISNYKKYMFQFNKLVSSPSFQSILLNVLNQNKSATEQRLLLQDTISSLIAASPAVEMVYILDHNKNIYHSYGTFYENKSDLFFFQPEEISGITLFPQQKNPFNSNVNVIPVVIPLTLKYFDQSTFTMITDTSEKPILYVTILIGSSSLNNLLQLWFNDYKSSNLFFINRDGILLSTPNQSNSSSSSYLNDIQSEKFLGPLFESSTIQQLKISDAYFTTTALTSNLALISITTKDDVFAVFSTMKKYMAFALILGLLLTAIMTLLISVFVSGPISKLAEIVHKIKTNTYFELVSPHSDDEVGELNDAINQMYLTIQEQIKQIKDSERQKFQTEIKLLSEQINPHLLYNTLEFINMEIYNNNTQVASSMVQALADYMRITLSYGNDKIVIIDELSQVRAYLKMMNYRFNNNIILLTSLSENLKYSYIIKSILQPFVENSIKHGFDMTSDISQIYNPTIEIAINYLDGQLHIYISDNGLGFNVTELYSLLQDNSNSASKRHIGLRNVIQRLEATYSQVSITLSSIPYYKNEIEICFPYKTELEIMEAINE